MLNLKTGNNKNKTCFEGNIIENITSQLGLHHLINELRHIFQNSSSCIDLIFKSQSNLVIQSGANFSLH